jgi:hypothetical protein
MPSQRRCGRRCARPTGPRCAASACARPPAPQNVTCTSELDAITVTGNLSAGAGCDLYQTKVNGNVTVQAGGSLVAADATIGGTLQSNGATSIDVDSTSIAHDVSIQGTTGSNWGDSDFTNDTLGGKLEIAGGVAQVVVIGDTAAGPVQVHDNRGSETGGAQADVAIYDDAVHGDLQVQNNELNGSSANVIEVANGPLVHAGSAVTGNVVVQGNSVTGGRFKNEVGVYENSVGGQLTFHNNSASGPVGSLNGNVVAANTVTTTLDCQGDNPVASRTLGTQSLAANSARQKTGECAKL